MQRKPPADTSDSSQQWRKQGRWRLLRVQESAPILGVELFVHGVYLALVCPLQLGPLELHSRWR